MKYRYTERVKEIVFVFVKYGFGYLFSRKSRKDKRSPANFRLALEELGPTFIKIGQILSTRPDILPKEYIDELIKLQDSVLEEDFFDMKKVFEDSLNMKMEDEFKVINSKAIAAASVSQVYYGVLQDGRHVAVKIQKPQIYVKLKTDFEILSKCMKFTKNKTKLSVINFQEILEEIRDTTIKELDFKIEAQNIKKFRGLNEQSELIYVPYVVEKYLSDKVIVMENIEGIKINEINRLKKSNCDVKDIALKLALNYCKQIFQDGFFHGDPHPGNILIKNEKICFIDFGIMGVLTEEMKQWFNKAIVAIVFKDKEKLTSCILAVSIKQGKVSKADIYKEVSYLFDVYLQSSIKNIKVSVLFQEILDISRKNNLQLPCEFVTLIRGFIILEGIISELNPDLQIINVADQYIKHSNKINVINNMTKEELLINMYCFGRDFAKIPTKTVDMINKISDGDIELKIKNNDINNIILMFNKMIDMLVEGIIASALILSSSLIISNGVQPLYRGVSVIGILGYIIAVILIVKIIMFNIKFNNK